MIYKFTKMKKILIFTLLFVIAQFPNLYSQNNIVVDGVIIPRTVKFSDKEITLNGVGSRTKLWFDVYTIGLYLSKPSQDPKEILESNSTMGMIFYITSGLINSKNFTKNVSKGLKESAGEELWLKFQPELALLEEFVSKEGITKNDVFNLVYNDTDSNIWVLRNGVLTGKIPGFDFKKALFGIWLSDNPVKASLKKELLGIN